MILFSTLNYRTVRITMTRLNDNLKHLSSHFLRMLLRPVFPRTSVVYFPSSLMHEKNSSTFSSLVLCGSKNRYFKYWPNTQQPFICPKLWGFLCITETLSFVYHATQKSYHQFFIITGRFYFGRQQQNSLLSFSVARSGWHWHSQLCKKERERRVIFFTVKAALTFWVQCIFIRLWNYSKSKLKR